MLLRTFLLLALAPIPAIAEPLRLLCEGPEETEQGRTSQIKSQVKHEVVLDRERGTITVGDFTVPYYLPDPPTSYKADDREQAQRDYREITYALALNRHTLEFYYSRLSGRRTWVTFVGKCTATDGATKE